MIRAITASIESASSQLIDRDLWKCLLEHSQPDAAQSCMLRRCVLLLEQLPNGWLWDMVDEFVYQFQSFQQYRGKLSQKSAEELTALRNCGRVWDVGTVLNYLQAFVRNSGITQELSTPGVPCLAAHSNNIWPGSAAAISGMSRAILRVFNVKT